MGVLSKMLAFSKVLVLLAVLSERAHSHGTIIGINGQIDGSSGSRSFSTHKGLHRPLQEYDQYSLLGVGGRIDEFDSAGGEPGQTQHGPQYNGVASDPSGKSWEIATTCKAGDIVKFRLAITANHGGINEFRYACADELKDPLGTLDFYDSVSSLPTANACYADNADSNIWRQSKCYRPRVLKRPNSAQSRPNFHPDRPDMFILAMPQGSECWEPQVTSSQGTGFDIEYQLPASLDTCRRVIVQWWWQTTNSCISPTWLGWKESGSWPCPSTQWPNWGFPVCDASKGSKATSGEQFAALIDIPLSDSVSCDSGSVAVTPTSPTPTPPTPPTPSGGSSTCTSGLKSFANTPSAGVCSCGTSWAAANRGGVRCSTGNAPTPPTPGGGCTAKIGKEAYSAFCTPTTQAGCEAGAAAAYCDWTAATNAAQLQLSE